MVKQSVLLKLERKDLVRGIRPYNNMPRNNGFFDTVDGAVIKDGLLQRLQSPGTTIDVDAHEVTGTDSNIYTCKKGHVASTDSRPITGGSWTTYWTLAGTAGGTWVDETEYSKGISDGFPYPQLFVLTNMILVCGLTDIHEWTAAGGLSWKLTVTGGQTWELVDYFDYLYMSNGVVSVTRNPKTQAYALTSLPLASCLCDFNGQAIAGAV
jgi:hypothetical protein